MKLGDYFGKRPVLLALVYYECPMLCTQVLNGVTGALKVLNFDVGREFDVVAVSINPKEGPGLASQKKQAYIERYGRPQTAAGWHFLTGEEENIRKLAAAVGFRYAYDEEIKQYAHGAGVELLTPKGVIARYFYGIEFAPRDIRLGIVEASEERIGSVDRCGAAALLSLRSLDGEVRRRRAPDGADRRARDHCRVWDVPVRVLGAIRRRAAAAPSIELKRCSRTFPSFRSRPRRRPDR